jgi:hypothetical protein
MSPIGGAIRKLMHADRQGGVLLCSESAVDGQHGSDDKAGRSTAEPEYRRRDLLGAAWSTYWLIPYDLLHRLGGYRAQRHDIWLFDNSTADSIDADATRRILQLDALRQADDAVLGGVIGNAAGRCEMRCRGRNARRGACLKGDRQVRLSRHGIQQRAHRRSLRQLHRFMVLTAGVEIREVILVIPWLERC